MPLRETRIGAKPVGTLLEGSLNDVHPFLNAYSDNDQVSIILENAYLEVGK
jgi:hypothetical protein